MWMIQPMTLNDDSCNLGTKSSLGLNCYFYSSLYKYKTDTRSHSASATEAASYPTYVYSDFEYQYTAQSIVFVALHQRHA